MESGGSGRQKISAELAQSGDPPSRSGAPTPIQPRPAGTRSVTHRCAAQACQGCFKTGGSHALGPRLNVPGLTVYPVHTGTISIDRILELLSGPAPGCVPGAGPNWTHPRDGLDRNRPAIPADTPAGRGNQPWQPRPGQVRPMCTAQRVLKPSRPVCGEVFALAYSRSRRADTGLAAPWFRLYHALLRVVDRPKTPTTVIVNYRIRCGHCACYIKRYAEAPTMIYYNFVRIPDRQSRPR